MLIYKTRKGKEIDQYEFYEDLQHFIDRNETMLKKDSAENYETIKKLRK
jgi:predicted transcriptional regulator